MHIPEGRAYLSFFLQIRRKMGGRVEGKTFMEKKEKQWKNLR